MWCSENPPLHSDFKCNEYSQSVCVPALPRDKRSKAVQLSTVGTRHAADGVPSWRYNGMTDTCQYGGAVSSAQKTYLDPPYGLPNTRDLRPRLLNNWMPCIMDPPLTVKPLRYSPLRKSAEVSSRPMSKEWSAASLAYQTHR